MEVSVVRHAKAGSRSRWDGPDRDRPLSRAGRSQAGVLAARLAAGRPARLVSSPYTRCVETLAPLSDRLGTAIEEDEGLAEGGDWQHALDLVLAAPAPLVLCSHGDVIGDLMYRLSMQGVPLDDDRIEKGSTWVLQVEDGTVVKARYLEPPERA